jgi:hypothetical protein
VSPLFTEFSSGQRCIHKLINKHLWVKLLNTGNGSLSLHTEESEPTCYSQAVKHDQWRQAMALELNALAKNNTWDLVTPPSCNR